MQIQVHEGTWGGVTEQIYVRRPDFALLGFHFPEDIPAGLVRCFHDASPQTRLVLQYPQVLLADPTLLKLNVAGLLELHTGLEILVKCLLEVNNGFRFAEEIPDSGQIEPLTYITQQEKIILYWLSQGLDGGHLSERLHISPHTLKNHKNNLVHKLGLRTAKDLPILAADYRSWLEKHLQG
jgi:DNA-binding CsgD family transcriptional regulator